MTEHPIELCQGRVMHARMRPFIHRFVYRVFCLRLRIDQPNRLASFNSWLFGIERSRPISFWSNDHGACDGSDLYVWIKSKVAQAGMQFEVGATTLQCFPRVLGYVFNPVSFWFIHDRAGQLRALLAEVNNTFGQKHQYLLSTWDLSPIGDETELECIKVFHVSPFCEVVGRYRFALNERAGHQRVSIDYHDTPDLPEPLLRTAIVTQARPLTTRLLLTSFVSMPMMTIGVMLRIHIQAFKLWRKGARFHSLPPRPEQELTTNQQVEK